MFWCCHGNQIKIFISNLATRCCLCGAYVCMLMAFILENMNTVTFSLNPLYTSLLTLALTRMMCYFWAFTLCVSVNGHTRPMAAAAPVLFANKKISTGGTKFFFLVYSKSTENGWKIKKIISIEGTRSLNHKQAPSNICKLFLYERNYHSFILALTIGMFTNKSMHSIWIDNETSLCLPLACYLRSLIKLSVIWIYLRIKINGPS